MQDLLRIGDADAADIRLVELGLQLEVGEDRGVAVVVEAQAVGIDDEGHRHAGDEAAVLQPDLRPVMAFERLDLDAGDLDADAPGGGADLLGRNAAIHQPGLDLAAADDRAAIFGGDLVGVAEMVEGRVADDDEIDLVEIARLGQRAGILVEERIAEDAQPRAGDDLVGGDAVEADAGGREVSWSILSSF